MLATSLLTVLKWYPNLDSAAWRSSGLLLVIQAVILLLAVQRSWPLLPRPVGVRTTQPQLHGRLEAKDRQAHLKRHRQVRLITRSKICDLISFRYQLDFSGKHSSHSEIRCKDYSLTFPPLSVARYSFIQLSELGRHGENENDQTSKRWIKRWGGGIKAGLTWLPVWHSAAELPRCN